MLENSPLVSVIIPNYNHEDFLEQRIQSVLGQTYQHKEVIIIDDASTDNSVSIIGKYANSKVVKKILLRKQNSGSPFGQWKAGLDYANGQFVWIAESDDYSDPNFLSDMVERAVINQAFLAYCQSYDVDQKGEILNDRLNYTEVFDPNIWKDDFCLSGMEFIEGYLIHKNVIPNVSACLVRQESLKDALSKIPDIIEYQKAGDWLLWMTICSLPHSRLCFKSNHLNFFRASPNNTRSKRSRSHEAQRFFEELKIKTSYSHFLHYPKIVKQQRNRLVRGYFTFLPFSSLPNTFLKLQHILKTSRYLLWLFFLAYKPLVMIKNLVK